MATNYRKWWDDFRSRINQQEQHVQFFKDNTAKLALDNVETMISIGAGSGETDIALIQHCLPRVKHYTGVEPDPHNRASLAEALEEHCPELKLKLVSDSMPGWPGPRCNKEPTAGPDICGANDNYDQVDLVVAIQVLWYFKDRLAVIKEMLRWLKPGGVLLIGHCYDDFIFARLVQRFAYNGGQKEYYVTELKNNLCQIGVRDIEEMKVPIRFRTTPEPDEVMLRYMLGPDTTDLDPSGMEKCVEEAKKRCLQQQPYSHSTNVFIRIVKEANL